MRESVKLWSVQLFIGGSTGMKKFLLYTGIVLAVLFMLLFGGVLWLATSTHTRLAAELAKVKAAGDPLTMADFKRGPIPDEQNAYFYLMQARGDLEALDKQIASLGYDAQRKLSPEELAALAKLVERNPRMYELLNAAAACPGYDAHIDWTQGIAVQLPHIMVFRSAARAFQLKALVQANQGEGDAALDQCVNSLRLTSHLQAEPILISHLVDIATQATAEQTGNHVLRMAETSPDARKKLDALLASLDNRKAALAAFKGERAMGVTTFAQLRSEGADSVEGAGPSPLGWMSVTWIGAAYLNDDEAKYLHLMARQIEALELPEKEREAVFAELDQELGAAGMRHMTSRLLMPAFEKAHAATTRAEALNRCLRVLLALQGKDETATLTSLNLPADVTTDPFSGKPLIVKRVGDQWLIYSVGDNGVDDGGNFDSSKGAALDVGFGPLEPAATSQDPPP
jgi:hypothetical protein